MAVDNTFEISYGGTAVGGASDTYQLDGPYIIEKGWRTFRLTFEVVVVASDAATLRSLSETLERDFRKRDKTLVIDTGSTVWTYTNNDDYFNPLATIVKSGDPEKDRGLSRSYLVTIEAELPSDGASDRGLLEIKSNVSFAASRQKTVTITGIYTATSSSSDSEANYLANADGECASILSGIDGSATFELVEEDYDFDRNTANTVFMRQYVELLFNQSASSLDDSSIKDHQVRFTDLSQHPADSRDGIQRLRRVVGAYDCSLDIDNETDLKSVFENKVRPHIIATFRNNFSPVTFCIETRSINYDETAKRMSVSLQFLYQKDGGEAVVEITQSMAYREQRVIDYTPTHDRDTESSFYADLGWSSIERIWTRTVVLLGSENPQRRISGVPRYNEAGDFDPIGGKSIEGRQQVNSSGWNIISNTSQAQPRWIGDPTSEDQLEMTVLTETVVERYNDAPGRSSGGGPISGNG